MGLCQVHNSFSASFFSLHPCPCICVDFSFTVDHFTYLNNAYRCITYYNVYTFIVFCHFQKERRKKLQQYISAQHTLYNANNCLETNKKTLNKYNDIIFIVIYLTWKKTKTYRRSILALNLSINMPYYRF